MTTSRNELLHLTVDLWHPSCWTLETTRGTNAGLYAHTAVPAKRNTTGLYTFYGRTQDALDTLTGTVRESALTESVTVLSRPTTGLATPHGSTAQSVLVEFDPGPSIKRAFTSRGFVHYGPTRHEHGRERRSLLVRTDRRTLRGTLEGIENEYDAEIDVLKLTTAPNDHEPLPSNRGPTDVSAGVTLTSRQRETFLLARSRGYYEYPRETTTRELAAELGISKTTLLEHLRKAESKLLTATESL